MALQLLEIFKQLNKSNCGECGRKTCLAFAQAVHSGQSPAGDCPHLGREAAESMSAQAEGPKAPEGFAASLENLREKVRGMDLEAAAPGLGATFRDGGLVIDVLGKEFFVDETGGLSSECHVNYWVLYLLLSYVSAPAPRPLEGGWVPFPELSRGQTTAAYFSRRFEDPLKVIADEHTEVLFELFGIFGGKEAARPDAADADYAFVLRPLPNVPMLVLYWRAEEDFPSRLRVMFDPSADSYLGPETITGMGRGIIEMFQKIIPKHEKGTLSLQYL